MVAHEGSGEVSMNAGVDVMGTLGRAVSECGGRRAVSDGGSTSGLVGIASSQLAIVFSNADLNSAKVWY